MSNDSITPNKVFFLKNHFFKLIELEFSFQTPYSNSLNSYFKSNKQLGSKDRKVLSQLAFTYLRYKFYFDSKQKYSNDEIFFIVFNISINVLILSDTFDLILKDWYKYSTIVNDNNSIYKDFQLDFVESIQKLNCFPNIYRKELINFDKQVINKLFYKSAICFRPAYSSYDIDKYKEILVQNGLDFDFNTLLCTFELSTFLNIEQIFKEANLPIEFQDNGSVIISKYIASLNGIKLLDACAGSGGKSLSVKFFNSECSIDLYDSNPIRLREFKNRNNKFSGLKTLSQLKDLSVYDIVFVDAPCSGSGTIRRFPDKLYSISESIIVDFHKLQVSVLNTYAEYVKIGGKLIYITCSLFSDENIEVVNEFINQNDNFIPKDIEDGIIINNSIKITNFAYQIIPINYNGDFFFISQFERIK